ncbi:MAG: hypothetical protein A2Y33_03340 [Spirochaetes bacterium GWF1_51_8]|nr:MAG: hypothetical protein A2Y33_03340 [Spirochaetes bacterium GWF1_51_8]
MIFQHDPKKTFVKGKEFFLDANFNDAAKSFHKSWNSQRSAKALSYLMLTHLLRSDFRAISRLMNEREFFGGFSWYTMYWCRFLTGDFYELDDILDLMLTDENYFIRAFSLYTIIKKRRSKEHRVNAEKYLKRAGLSYEMTFEERRASIYVDLIHDDPHAALESVRRLVCEFPKVPEVYIDLFEVLARIDDPDVSKELIYDPAVQNHARKDYRLMYLIAREFYRVDDLENSKLAMKILCNVFRSNTIFYYNIGNTFFRQRNMGNAVDNYKKAIEFAPLFERAYYNLGTLFLKAGYLIDAERALDNAVRIVKKNDNLNNLTACYISGKRLEEAYEFLQRVTYVDREFKERSAILKNRIKQVMILT